VLHRAAHRVEPVGGIRQLGRTIAERWSGCLD
jgi:hypothetical protein